MYTQKQSSLLRFIIDKTQLNHRLDPIPADFKGSTVYMAPAAIDTAPGTNDFSFQTVFATFTFFDSTTRKAHEHAMNVQMAIQMNAFAVPLYLINGTRSGIFLVDDVKVRTINGGPLGAATLTLRWTEVVGHDIVRGPLMLDVIIRSQF